MWDCLSEPIVNYRISDWERRVQQCPSQIRLSFLILFSFLSDPGLNIHTQCSIFSNMSFQSSLDESRGASEKAFLSDDGDEEQLFSKPLQTRWRQEQRTTIWRSSSERHWKTTVVHLMLLAINLTVVTLYATTGRFGQSCFRSDPDITSIQHP